MMWRVLNDLHNLFFIHPISINYIYCVHINVHVVLVCLTKISLVIAFSVSIWKLGLRIKLPAYESNLDFFKASAWLYYYFEK